jgi:hypothetical protein
MHTLEKLQLTEAELDDVLLGLYESSDDPEKENYKKFIKEDATLKQKFALLEQNKRKFYSLIEEMAYNCRQAVGGKTFERQMGMVECGTLEAVRMIGAANMFKEADEKFLDAWVGQLERRTTKLENYLSKADESSLLTEGGWKTLFGWFLVGPVYWAAYRGIRALVDEKSKRCGVLSIGRQRDVCMWKLRAEQNQKMAALISKNMVNCKNSKNPEKCKAAGAKKMAEYNAKAKKYMDKISTYSNKAPAKKAKADVGLQRAAAKADSARV